MKRPKTGIILLTAASLFLFLYSYQALKPVRISVKISDTAPLGALLKISTLKPARAGLVIKGRNNNDIEVDFSDLSRRHRIPVLGLYPDYNNQVQVNLRTESGQTYTRTMTIKTEPLPAGYPDIHVKRLLPDLAAPGMIFMNLGRYDNEGSYHPLPSAIDPYGYVRWFYTGEIGHVLKKMKNGNLLIQRNSKNTGKGQLENNDSVVDRLMEIDMLGREISVKAEVKTGIHHDAVIMPDGNILVLTSAPGSYDDGVVEIDGLTGRVIQGWDLGKIIDPNRPPQPRNLEKQDWLHLNGIDYNPYDDSFILSGRDQSAVIKIRRESGELQWIAGNHHYWTRAFKSYLLEPDETKTESDTPFEWQWGQHAPKFHPQDPNRILLYDNGNDRSYEKPVLPQNNYSRAVEYQIDPSSMQIRQIWEYGQGYGSELYTPFIGDAVYLSNNNRLVCFGGITRSLSGDAMDIFDFNAGKINRMKISARIIEVTSQQPAREVMIISIEDKNPESYSGYRVYRAEKIPLYP